MTAFIDKYYFLKSRKFWTFVGSVLTLMATGLSLHPYPTVAVIQGVVALAVGYMATVAWEDTAAKNAEAAKVAAILASEAAAKQAEAIEAAAKLVAATPPVVVNVPAVTAPAPATHVPPTSAPDKPLILGR